MKEKNNNGNLIKTSLYFKFLKFINYQSIEHNEILSIKLEKRTNPETKQNNNYSAS